jgi:lipopolysaccharide export system protein LptA
LKHGIKVTFVFLIALFCNLLIVSAQNPDKLKYKADVLEGGKTYKKLIGNVKFTQKNTIIYSDSAFFYDATNSTEAFGNVRIEDLEDSTTITADKLYYDGNGRIAELRGDVVYVDDSIRLFTDNLDYDMINKSASYFGGGRIIDDKSTMRSIKGNYDTEGKMMVFTDSVQLVTPDYTLESDDLIYNILTKKARTSSETKITTKTGRVLKSQQSSEFDTRLGTYAFMVGEIDTEKYHIKGNELFFNNKTGSYSAKGDVFLVAKEDDIIITGDEAEFWEAQGIARVYGDPLLRRAMNEDTLFLRADTLISIDDSLEINKRLLAFHNVKIFKSDIQGKADSMAYFLSDSSIVFYRDPILWNDKSQITADTIHILINNGTIDKLNAKVNSFIISEDSTGNYNQIKGRLMTAFFNGKSIRNVDVNGNGETIYWVADEENTSEIVGMNKIICSDMRIDFKDNQVHDIRIYVSPDGDFIPPHELKDDQKTLEGFAWRTDERPSLRTILVNPSELDRVRREAEEIYQEEIQNAAKTSQTNEKTESSDSMDEKPEASEIQNPPQK